MKNEKLRQAIQLIDDDLIEEADRKTTPAGMKKILKWSGALAAAAAAVVLTFVFWPKESAPLSEAPKPLPETKEKETVTVLYAGSDATEPDSFSDWNGSGNYFSYLLTEKLKTAKEDDVFAVVVTPYWQEAEFEYQGKKLTEYDRVLSGIEADLVRMEDLLKTGDSLKYGSALYEGGAPNGEKWAKSWYDQVMERLGKELVGRYVQNGEFFAEKLEVDRKALEQERDDAKKAFEEARGAYLKSVAATFPQRLPADLREASVNRVLVFLTKGELDAYSRTVQNWIFSLAVKPGESVEE